MPADKIHLSNAKHHKLFYLVANVVVYRKEDGKCLILKRHEREKVHPGKYAVPGGKLEWKDLPVEKPSRLNNNVLDYENAIEELLARETLEEAGIEIDLSNGLKYINSVAFIRPDGIPVVLVKFATHYKRGNIVLEKSGFTDHAWVDAEEIKNYDCIEGVDLEVAQTIKMFKKEL
jgi:8-oxo-dGTP pyrophosphatase MutT (NUDIX family)